MDPPTAVASTRARPALLLLSTGLIVMGPKLRVLDVHVVASVLAAALGAVTLLRRRTVARSIAVAVAFTYVAMTYAVFVLIWRGSPDLTTLYVGAIFTVYLLAGVYLGDLYSRHFPDSSVERFTAHIGLVTFVNALVVIVSLVSEPVRRVLFEYFAIEWNEAWVSSGHRGMDVSIGGGAMGAAVFATIGVWYLWVAANSRWRLHRFAMGVAILFAAVALGRSAFIVILFETAALILLRRRQTGSTGRPVSKLVLAGTVAAGALATAAFVGMSSGAMPSSLEESFRPWLTEPFSSDGDAPTTLTVLYSDMLIVPSDTSQLVFGAGNAGRATSLGLDYVASDLGYVRSVFAVGVLGAIALYSANIYLTVWGHRHRRSSRAAVGMFVFGSALLLMNFKEWHLVWRSGSIVLFTLAVLASSKAAGRTRRA